MKRMASLLPLIVVLLVALAWLTPRGEVASQAADQPAAKATIADLQKEIEQLKTLVPDQASAMADVGQHFSNLWFAAEAKHWPLADFYFKETRSHLRWAVRLKPIRKDNAEKEINLPKILEALETSPLKQLEEAIQAKDYDAFSKAYRFTLEGCYACHKASDKPFMRPMVPQHPGQPILNNDPAADWPR